MKISQREARRIRKELAELKFQNERRFSKYRSDFVGGTWISTIELSDWQRAQVDTARRLDFALIAKVSDKKLDIYAVRV